MTDREKGKDFKDFSELLKAEVAKLGSYDNLGMGGTNIEIDNKVENLHKQVVFTTRLGKRANLDVIQAALELAAQCLVIACNAKREYKQWEDMYS